MAGGLAERDAWDNTAELYDTDNRDWWWTPAGVATRYAIGAILLALLIFWVGAYLHAKTRASKGLEPLRYHRWMVRRQPRYDTHVQYAYGYRYPPAQYGQGQAYPMHSYAPPPPAYHNADGPPPAYQPPPGGSKVVPDQHGAEGMDFGPQAGGSGVAAPPPVARQ